jgi:16S rRNA (guanine527-N7)-methyltransferase
LGVQPEHREKFGAAVARAVAPLPVLLEYCLPFVRINGIFIAMKGDISKEIEASSKALEVLGGKITEVKELVLPFGGYKRRIIIVKKFRQTPTKYPRKAGKPTKSPIS